jgi:hypothetical protein
VLDPTKPGKYSPNLHVNYAPSLGLKAGQKVTLKVRAFNTEEGEETWDFGDGTPTVQTRSDGNGPKLNPDGYAIVEHVYNDPGVYLVRVVRQTSDGTPAIDHVDVFIEKP